MRTTTLIVLLVSLLLALTIVDVQSKIHLPHLLSNRRSRSIDDQQSEINNKEITTAVERLKAARSTPLTQRSNDPTDYEVTQLPGLSASVNITHYAGYININEQTNGNLFFWLIQANATNYLDLPFLIWINGGPGCSSMDGLFVENGPFRLTNDSGDYLININPSSWHNVANVLYIDEPVGTGFSYVTNQQGYVTDDTDLEIDFYIFLQEFFGIFSEFKTLPLFISGESFAGHYIPHYANYILEMNTAIGNGTLNETTLNLKGLAIGNGWTHPITQYDSYSEIGYAAGIISLDQYNAYKPLVAACQAQINLGVYDSIECGNVLGQLSDDSGTNTTSQVNVYDYRLYDPTGGVEWPVGIFNEAAYLALPSVRQAIHVDTPTQVAPTVWAECNGTASQFLTNTDESSLALFPNLLANLRVLVYNGQFDIICNHIGTQEYLNQMEWNGATEWNAQQRVMWFAEKDNIMQTAGYVKGPVQNLTFMLVLGGSHMVPMDQPEFTFDMINKFMNNQTYASSPQTNGVIDNTKIITSPLTQTSWILIIFGCFTAGIILGGFIIFGLYRHKIIGEDTSYHKVN
ncbi:hypothetical protein SAMD00019534_029020 [Acytostelium subglobosum LB1]|uniref:hypothetical protein n=1 Tax=Acytostelium subglobosum LB1 TaxID=1410327 RepID=UPI00064510BE|nr:hypothetical protein SAMD00019534_029020 [Acytostelium subglobosum LB1]GAM19727.1 hypothetical protein SAMD00019534_029020 [Acytostelium subglobosum LB1]|eukprot:XP_012756489.1 hypothetical protein SAMD00019534_029020 [Acytostelium subglobosum LB1]